MARPPARPLPPRSFRSDFLSQGRTSLQSQPSNSSMTWLLRLSLTAPSSSPVVVTATMGANHHGSDRTRLVGFVSPVVPSTAHDDRVALLDEDLAAFQFEHDLPRKDQHEVDGVRDVHAGTFGVESLTKLERPLSCARSSSGGFPGSTKASFFGVGRNVKKRNRTPPGPGNHGSDCCSGLTPAPTDPMPSGVPQS